MQLIDLWVHLAKVNLVVIHLRHSVDRLKLLLLAVNCL